MKLEKFKVYRLDLPVPEVTRQAPGGKPITVTTTEMHGSHRCISVAVDPHEQFAVVVPLTSATDPQGGEKFRSPKSSWLRMIHDGRPVYALTEQIRYADTARFFEDEGWLIPYDEAQLSLKLKALFGFN